MALWSRLEASRPDPDTPRRRRRLPEYDNVLLGHADRSPFRWSGASMADAVKGTVLVDGVVRAVWRPVDAGLEVDAVDRLPKRAVASIRAEGRRLLAFLRPDDRGLDVRVRVPG